MGDVESKVIFLFIDVKSPEKIIRDKEFVEKGLIEGVLAIFFIEKFHFGEPIDLFYYSRHGASFKYPYDYILDHIF